MDLARRGQQSPPLASSGVVQKQFRSFLPSLIQQKYEVVFEQALSIFGLAILNDADYCPLRPPSAKKCREFCQSNLAGRKETTLSERSKDLELLTTEEAASYLKVSKYTVWRWCKEGRLPAFQIGRAWRIRKTKLNEMIAELEQQNHTPDGD